jgi:chaperone BCS1
MDIHVEFKLASKYQAAELYRCFYLPAEDDNDDAADDDEEKKSVDSGLDPVDNVDHRETLSEVSYPPSPIAVSPSPSERSTVTGRSHRARAPKLSHSKITSLADRFSDGIPEREFSMASLQGYLMAYKTRPFDAVKDVSGWVAKNRLPKASSVDSGTT